MSENTEEQEGESDDVSGVTGNGLEDPLREYNSIKEEYLFPLCVLQGRVIEKIIKKTLPVKLISYHPLELLGEMGLGIQKEDNLFVEIVDSGYSVGGYEDRLGFQGLGKHVGIGLCEEKEQLNRENLNEEETEDASFDKFELTFNDVLVIAQRNGSFRS